MQIVKGLLAALLVLLPTDLANLPPLLDVATAAGWSALVALVTWLHNELEDAGRVRDTRGGAA